MRIESEKGIPNRSKAQVTSGVAAQIKTVDISLGKHLKQGDVLFTYMPQPILHDSVTPSTDAGMSFKQMLVKLWQTTGIREFIVQTENDWTLSVVSDD